jgi:uncharacterized protein
MPRNTQPSQPVDLDLLDAFLMSDDAPETSMGLSDLDGFLTGLAIGPETIPPSEWIPVIWGDEEPEFATVEGADAILGTIMARYNEILAQLKADPDSFDPVFLEGEEGNVIVSDWAAGFMDAVALRAPAWEPIFEDDDGSMLMLPLMALASDDERPLFDDVELPAEEADKLRAHGADILMEAIPAIYEFWQERRS